MTNDRKRDSLLETSRAPAFRKVARVPRGAQPGDASRQGAGSGSRPRRDPQGTLHRRPSSCASNGSACGAKSGCSARSRQISPSRVTTCARRSAPSRCSSCARRTAGCARSTTCACTAATGCGRPASAAPRLSSARTTTGNTGSTARSSGSPTWTPFHRAPRPAVAWRSSRARPGAVSSGSASTGRPGRSAITSSRSRRTSSRTTSTRWR